MRKRITLLIAALMLALTMSFGSVAAFAAKTTTEPPESPGTCTVKAGNGQGGGEIKESHHGTCDSNGAAL
jgi:Tfp pilus assembly major pilin PilA